MACRRMHRTTHACTHETPQWSRNVDRLCCARYISFGSGAFAAAWLARTNARIFDALDRETLGGDRATPVCHQPWERLM